MNFMTVTRSGQIRPKIGPDCSKVIWCTRWWWRWLLPDQIRPKKGKRSAASGFHHRNDTDSRSTLSIPTPHGFQMTTTPANEWAAGAICFCISKTSSTPGDVGLTKLCGDLTQVVNLNLRLGEACYFQFRQVDVYFCTTIDAAAHQSRRWRESSSIWH